MNFESNRLDDHRRPVREHFGTPGHDLGGIVSNCNDRIRAHLRGVLNHDVVCFHSRLFGEFRQNRDVSSHEGLEGCANVSHDGSRPNRDATDDAKMARNFIAFEIVAGGYPLMKLAHMLNLHTQTHTPNDSGKCSK